MVPRMCDGEDMNIFTIVDTPADAVARIAQCQWPHCWAPASPRLAKLTAGSGKGGREAAGSGSAAAEPGNAAAGGARAEDAANAQAGDGTRYGTRPARGDNANATASQKPEQ